MGNDRKHFEQYREQTRVKHEILEKYLPAYFRIRKTIQKNLVYIDAFAGPGRYQLDAGSKEFTKGSPILAMEAFAKIGDAGKIVTSIFVEKDPLLYSQLEQSVKEYMVSNEHLRHPEIIYSTFEDAIGKLFADLGAGGNELAPSFMFVDPCGIEGVSYASLIRYLKESHGEAFLFFNIDGVKRIAGLGTERIGDTLPEFLGGRDRAEHLIVRLNTAQNTREKESIILAYYAEILREDIGNVYIAPFRVEYENRRVTSHYLIHITYHKMGFRIMKEIMWPIGKTAEGEGALALEQASVRGTAMLLRPRWENVKSKIESQIRAKRQVKADYFYAELSERRDNYLCAPAYRKALLELEAERRIEVVDSKTGQVKPAAARQKRSGKPTLAKTYLLRMAR